MEGHAERDQRHLRGLTDPQPNDEQRDQPHPGHGPQHLYGRVHEILAEPGQPGHQGQRGPDHAAEDQARGNPLE